MTSALTSVGIQYGTVTIANGATTGTATINAVGAGAFLLYEGQTTTLGTANPARCLARITKTNSTTITATRNTADTATITVSFCIVDGDTTNLIKSVQYGNINFGTGTTGTATITAVTTANTAVHCLGFTHTATTTSPITLWPALSLTSTTQVTATVGSASGTLAITVEFVVIEFQAAALAQSVQAIADSAAPAGTTRTKTITSVTLNNSFVIWAGQFTTGGASYASGDQYGQLTAATTLTIGTSSAPNVTIQYNAYIVELASALVETSSQRGNISIVAGTSGTATLSPAVIVADAMMTFCGNQTSGTTFDKRNSSLALTNTTTVTASTNTSATTKTGWEVIALNPAAAAGNTVTETATETDSYTVSRTASTTFTETATETDSYIGKETSAALTISETQTETDSVLFSQTGKGLVIENNTETDSYTNIASSSVTRSETVTESDSLIGIRTASDGSTESIISNDTHTIIAIDSGLFEEDIAANDNYNSDVIPSPSPSPSPVISNNNGPGDGKRDKYLKWLKKRKKKQFKKKAIILNIPKEEVIRIIEIAEEVIHDNKPEVISNNPYIFYEAPKIYNIIWEQEIKKMKESHDEYDEEDDEEDEFLMMM